LNDKIKNHKNSYKRANETNKEQKKRNQTKINIITIEKKLINLIWMIKLKTIKTLTKESRKKIRNKK
jgi:hypothetical protein